ncbi:MAG: anti-sigma factor family protein [Longimicrobiales bacterium]
MNEHIHAERLHDYVDDLLCREERAEIERHLVVCDTCAREVGALRDLLHDVATLPASRSPERDLLPGIHARMDAPMIGARESAIGSRRMSGRAALLAASVALIAALGIWRWNGDVLSNDTSLAPSSVAAAAASLEPVERDYARAEHELQRLFAASPSALRPETRRIVAENLAIIDRALAEARAALQDDPGNPVLERILLANHEKKLDLLRGAARAGT